MLGIQDLKSRSEFGYVTSFELLLFLDANCNFIIKIISKLSEPHHFQVKDDLSHIFNNTLNGRKFMEHTWYFNSSDRITLQGRQQYSPECIADSNSVSFFQRFECEQSVEV